MRIIRNFLTDVERVRLWALAEDSVYEPGRQGTGYDRTPVPDDLYDSLRVKALKELGVIDNPLAYGHDCYVIRYVEGAYIPLHCDDAPLASEHHRINAVIQNPYEGGDLYVNGEKVDLFQRDAYVFRPDTEPHEVKVVTSGTRLIFTLGVLK